MRLIAIAGLAFALAGCQSMKDALDPSLPPPTAPIDAKIAKVSEELAKQCALLATGIVLADTFTSKPEIEKTLKIAEAARASFCAAPPTDVNTAIATVASMAIAINVALRGEQTASVTP